MRLCTYSVRDKAVGAFMTPFFCRTDAEAVRSFSDACGDPKHQFASHAEDYELYLLDGWDDATGQFEGRSPSLLITGLAVSSLLVQGSPGR